MIITSPHRGHPRRRGLNAEVLQDFQHLGIGLVKFGDGIILLYAPLRCAVLVLDRNPRSSMSATRAVLCPTATYSQ